MPVRKVAVTGTKGKTTVVNIVAELLRKLGEEKVLHVNTNGHYINGKKRSDTQDSINTWSIKPTVAPGRFLFEFFKQDLEDKRYAAVLEASLSSGTTIGTAYPVAHVAVFLNVFDDHIGSSVRTELRSREDIARLKSFVYERVANNSYLVVNADDPLVMNARKVVPKSKMVKHLYFGEKENYRIVKKRKEFAGLVYEENGSVFYCDTKKERKVIDVANVPWTFEGLHKPSVRNVLAIVATIIGFYEGRIPRDLKKHLTETDLDQRSGRLVRLKNKKSVTLIADYAHESESLRELAEMARTQLNEGGKIIGVVRIAHNRSLDQVKKVAKSMAKHYDQLVIYDKIDGYWYVPEKAKQKNKKFPKVVGKASQDLYDAVAKSKTPVKRFLREDKAVEHAAKLARPGDVVISIVGDDIERSLGFLKDSFGAKLTFRNTQ